MCTHPVLHPRRVSPAGAPLAVFNTKSRVTIVWPLTDGTRIDLFDRNGLIKASVETSKIARLAYMSPSKVFLALVYTDHQTETFKIDCQVPESIGQPLLGWPLKQPIPFNVDGSLQLYSLVGDQATHITENTVTLLSGPVMRSDTQGYIVCRNGQGDSVVQELNWNSGSSAPSYRDLYTLDAREGAVTTVCLLNTRRTVGLAIGTTNSVVYVPLLSGEPWRWAVSSPVSAIAHFRSPSKLVVSLYNHSYHKIELKEHSTVNELKYLQRAVSLVAMRQNVFITLGSGPVCIFRLDLNQFSWLGCIDRNGFSKGLTTTSCRIKQRIADDSNAITLLGDDYASTIVRSAFLRINIESSVKLSTDIELRGYKAPNVAYAVDLSGISVQYICDMSTGELLPTDDVPPPRKRLPVLVTMPAELSDAQPTANLQLDEKFVAVCCMNRTLNILERGEDNTFTLAATFETDIDVAQLVKIPQSNSFFGYNGCDTVIFTYDPKDASFSQAHQPLLKNATSIFTDGEDGVAQCGSRCLKRFKAPFVPKCETTVFAFGISTIELLHNPTAKILVAACKDKIRFVDIDLKKTLYDLDLRGLRVLKKIRVSLGADRAERIITVSKSKSKKTCLIMHWLEDGELRQSCYWTQKLIRELVATNRNEFIAVGYDLCRQFIVGNERLTPRGGWVPVSGFPMYDPSADELWFAQNIPGYEDMLLTRASGSWAIQLDASGQGKLYKVKRSHLELPGVIDLEVNLPLREQGRVVNLQTEPWSETSKGWLFAVLTDGGAACFYHADDLRQLCQENGMSI